MHSKKCNKLIELIKENPGISIVELQMAVRENYYSVICTKIKNLKDCSLVDVVKEGRNRRVYFNYDAERPLQLMNNLAKMLVNAND